MLKLRNQIVVSYLHKEWKSQLMSILIDKLEGKVFSGGLITKILDVELDSYKFGIDVNTGKLKIPITFTINYINPKIGETYQGNIITLTPKGYIVEVDKYLRCLVTCQNDKKSKSILFKVTNIRKDKNEIKCIGNAI
jgi:DNA-directed RNA polymerase subunit E'/Rpb7